MASAEKRLEKASLLPARGTTARPAARRKLSHVNGLATRGTTPFILPSSVGIKILHCPCQTCDSCDATTKRHHSDCGGDRCTDRGTNRPSACGRVVVRPTVRACVFCSPAAGPSLAGWSLGDGSDGRDMTGKRGLWRARSESSGVGDEGGADTVPCDADCREEPMSAVSIPVPAGISKSGASPLATVVRTASAKP